MIKGILKLVVVVLLLTVLDGCNDKKVPLDKDQFTALLTDMHRIDGTIAANRGLRSENVELKNYAYYNDLFRKYGISKADFDSCMYYYSAQTVLFSKMYDVIIDSLNRRLTTVDKVLNDLKSKDSVNYFPVLDTMRLDSMITVKVDSIVPGLYKFNTIIRFDSVSNNSNRYITSYFLSEDNKDTLRVRNLAVSIDTVQRNYNWSQYVDSVYTQLVVNYLEIVRPTDKPKTSLLVKNAKANKKPKEIRLKDFGGQSWNNQLFRPYISKETEKRLKQNLRH